jgi:hypothetical protein
MIKKRLKKFYFIQNDNNLNLGVQNTSLFNGDNLTLTTVDNYLTISDIRYINQNVFRVNLNNQEVLLLDEHGNMRINGRINALGTVIYNQELNRLQFWDGVTWQDLITHNIV